MILDVTVAMTVETVQMKMAAVSYPIEVVCLPKKDWYYCAIRKLVQILKLFSNRALADLKN